MDRLGFTGGWLRRYDRRVVTPKVLSNTKSRINRCRIILISMRNFRAFLTMLVLSTATWAVAQQDQSALRDALSGFDQEHDLAKKEYRL